MLMANHVIGLSEDASVYICTTLDELMDRLRLDYIRTFPSDTGKWDRCEHAINVRLRPCDFYKSMGIP